MDVYCAWDKDQPELDTNEFSRALRPAVRLQFSRSNTKPEHPVDKASDWFKKYCVCSKMDVDELAKFVAQLEPKAVSDLKPMVVLLQGVLRTVLLRQSDIVKISLQEEVDALNGKIAEYDKIMVKLEEKKQADRLVVIRRRWKTVLRTIHMQRMFGLKRLCDAEQNKRINTLEEEKEMLKLKADKDSHINNWQKSTLEQNMEDARAQLRNEKEKMQDEMEQIAAKTQRQRDALQVVEKEAAVRRLELKTLTESITAERKRIKEREEWIQSQHQAAIARKEAQIKKLEQYIETLESENLKEKAAECNFFPWMLYRPMVEYECAAKVTCKMTTVTVPPCSVVTLPSFKKTEVGWHVTNVPASSLITLSTDDPFAEVALPWNSSITFPDGQGEVTMPGGSSLVLPEAEKPWKVTIKPGTKIYIPPFWDPNSGGNGENVPYVAEKEKVHTLPGGTYLLTPLYRQRTAVTVPSGTSLIVPKGGNCFVRMPGGSRVLINKNMDAQVMVLPPKSTITVPKKREGLKSGSGGFENLRRRSIQSLQAAHRVHEGMLTAKDSFILILPLGAHVKLPHTVEGGAAHVTLPSGAKVYAPKGDCEYDEQALLSASVRPGQEMIVHGRLQRRLRLLPGSTIQLPPPWQIKPEQLAQRLKETGPEAAGMALGKMDPYAAAEALPLMHFKDAAIVLCHARPEAAAKVLAKMKGGELASVLIHVGDKALGVILRSMDLDDVEVKLQEFFGNDPRLYKNILKSAEIWRNASEAVSRDIPICKKVDALQTLQPHGVAVLLAQSDSKVASFSLKRLASRADKFAGAAMTELTKMSDRMVQLGTRYMEQDAHRAQLLEQVACQVSETAMLHELRTLLDYVKAAYGVGCTLQRGSGKSEPEEPDAGEAATASKGNGKWKKIIKSQAVGSTNKKKPETPTAPATSKPATGARPRRVSKLVTSPQTDAQTSEWTPRPPTTDGKKTPRNSSHEGDGKKAARQYAEEPKKTPRRGSVGSGNNEDTLSYSGEERTLHELDLVYCTEDVHFGLTRKALVGNKTSATMEELSVHISVKTLLETVQEAFKTKEAVQTGLLIVVPIFVATTGRPWGSLIHVNKMEAAEEVMGGILERPKMNSVPLALENMKLAAQAVAAAVTVTERNLIGKDYFCLELEVKTMLESNLAEKSFSQELVDNMAFLLDLHTKRHRKLVSDLTDCDVVMGPTTEKLFAELEAIQSAPAPPPPCVRRTLVALLLYLGTEELLLKLGELKGEYPEEDAELWAAAKGAVVLNSHHPSYIGKLLKRSKAEIPEREHAPRQAMVEAVAAVLEGVGAEDLKKEYPAVGEAFNLVTVAFKAIQLVDKMTEVLKHKNETELESFVVELF